MTQLFTKEQAPRTRKRPRKLMHVVDGGSDCVHFVCGHCGHDNGWIEWVFEYEGITVTKAKRSIPCPKCEGEDAYRGAV